MDQNDFKLTEEQQRIVGQFTDVYKQMKEAGVSLVLSIEIGFSYISFVNGSNAECFGNEDDFEEYGPERIDITDVVDNSESWIQVDYQHNEWRGDRIFALPKGVELY